MKTRVGLVGISALAMFWTQAALAQSTTASTSAPNDPQQENAVEDISPAAEEGTNPSIVVTALLRQPTKPRC